MRLDKMDITNPHLERSAFLSFTRKICTDQKSQSFRWMYNFLVSSFVRADKDLTVSYMIVK